jgi:hypothetical protein
MKTALNLNSYKNLGFSAKRQEYLDSLSAGASEPAPKKVHLLYNRAATDVKKFVAIYTPSAAVTM